MEKSKIDKLQELKELCKDEPYILKGFTAFSINMHKGEVWLYRRRKIRDMEDIWPCNLDTSVGNLLDTIYMNK